jgi:hypothetical protein
MSDKYDDELPIGSADSLHLDAIREIERADEHDDQVAATTAVAFAVLALRVDVAELAEAMRRRDHLIGVFREVEQEHGSQ